MLFSLPPCSRQEPEFACSKQKLKHAMLPSVSLQNRYIRVMFASSVSNNINIITPRVPVVSHITIFDVSTVCSKLQLEQFALKIASTATPCLFLSPPLKLSVFPVMFVLPSSLKMRQISSSCTASPEIFRSSPSRNLPKRSGRYSHVVLKSTWSSLFLPPRSRHQEFDVYFVSDPLWGYIHRCSALRAPSSLADIPIYQPLV